MEKEINLSTGGVIIVTKKRKYASIITSTGRTAFDVKNPNELLDLTKPYKARKYDAKVSSTGITILNLKIEHADEVTEKLKTYLENDANLKPLTKKDSGF